MSSNITGCVLAEQGIREHLDCGRTKAQQIIVSEVLPTFVVGRNRYARKVDIERLLELFATADAKAAYARASYDNKRRERSAKTAAVVRVASQSKANAQ